MFLLFTSLGSWSIDFSSNWYSWLEHNEFRAISQYLDFDITVQEYTPDPGVPDSKLNYFFQYFSALFSFNWRSYQKIFKSKNSIFWRIQNFLTVRLVWNSVVRFLRKHKRRLWTPRYVFNVSNDMTHANKRLHRDPSTNFHHPCQTCTVSPALEVLFLEGWFSLVSLTLSTVQSQ